MRKVDNLKGILLKSYTAWALYISGAVEILFEFGLDQEVPLKVRLGMLGMVLLGRSVKQKSVSGGANE